MRQRETETHRQRQRETWRDLDREERQKQINRETKRRWFIDQSNTIGVFVLR